MLIRKCLNMRMKNTITILIFTEIIIWYYFWDLIDGNSGDKCFGCFGFFSTASLMKEIKVFHETVAVVKILTFISRAHPRCIMCPYKTGT